MLVMSKDHPASLWWREINIAKLPDRIQNDRLSLFSVYSRSESDNHIPRVRAIFLSLQFPGGI